LFNREIILKYCKANYDVTQHTIRKGYGNHSLSISEFKEIGVRRVIICQNTKGVWIEFWSTDDLALLISGSLDISIGERSSSHGVWRMVNSTEEASLLLKDVVSACKSIEENDVEEEYKREDIESKGLDKLNIIEKEKYNGFWEVAKKINNHVGSIFHVDHASSIKEAREASIIATNLQLLIKGINTSKNSKSWKRLDWEAQREHILINIKLIPDVNPKYIEFLLERLRLYWD
jgi:hypothetical protein